MCAGQLDLDIQAGLCRLTRVTTFRWVSFGLPKSVPNVASPCYHWAGPGGQQTTRGAVFGVWPVGDCHSSLFLSTHQALVGDRDSAIRRVLGPQTLAS
jgi:hypothetical protein